MRSRMIIAVSALGLLAGPALAQTASPPASSPPGGLTMPRPATPAPVPDPLAQEDTAQIKGSTVYGSDNKKIGAVSTVLMKPRDKTIDRLVVSEGGLLGVGSHRVALPVSDFKWNSNKGGFTIGKTADELKSMPEWRAASASADIPSSGSSSSGSSSSGSSQPLSTAPSGSLAAPGKAAGSSSAGSSGGSTSTDE